MLVAALFWRLGSPDVSPPGEALDTPATAATRTSQISPPTESAPVAASRDGQEPAAQGGAASGGFRPSTSRAFVAPQSGDPFLAPNAVAQPPAAPTPPSVHRPTNVGEQPPAGTSGEVTPASPASNSSPSATGTNTPQLPPPASSIPTVTPTPQPQQQEMPGSGSRPGVSW